MIRLSPSAYKTGLQRRARAMPASGPPHPHAEGVIVSYVDQPTFVIVTDEGRTVPWRCDLTDVGELVSDEEYYRHATARRLRDGRNSVRPEFVRELPGHDFHGATLAQMVAAAIAAGRDLNDVVVEADYEQKITLEAKQ